MATSKLIPSSSSSKCAPTSNLHHHQTTTTPSLCSFTTIPEFPPDQPHSLTMDDLLKNIYNDSSSSPFPTVNHSSATQCVGRARAVGEVWREIVSGTDHPSGNAEDEEDDEREMTLEDFLAGAGVVREEDVGISTMAVMPPAPAVMCIMPGGSTVSSEGGSSQFQSQLSGCGGCGTGGQLLLNGNGAGAGGGGGGARVKRRAVEEAVGVVVDKVTQQKQRRMIKNRESAARSRERKQAYTLELEALVAQLEEENACLHREEEEQKRERLKQLMRSVIPVVDKRRPVRALRKVNSMSW